MMIDREMKTTINNWILQGKEAFLLTGARQIGKTYLIRECLKESKYDYIALNFIERPELVELFENATNAQDLLMRLSLITDKQLNKGNTIIFFDEIQEFKDIVTRIKFLVEEGSYRYIMSGSLLGVELLRPKISPSRLSKNRRYVSVNSKRIYESRWNQRKHTRNAGRML